MTIVEEIRQNRESGARRLDAEYKVGLMTLARRFCADESDAEELVNRTFAAVVERIDDYLEQSAFFGWMSQILVNIHSMDVRRKSNDTVVYPGELPDSCDEAAENRIFAEVDASLLRDAVRRFPKDQRELLILHYFMEMPVAKIAKFLAIPQGTVMSRLHYARKALAAKLGVAAKKPGVKALLLALALAALTAVGAVGVAAIRSAAEPAAEPQTTEPLVAAETAAGNPPIAATNAISEPSAFALRATADESEDKSNHLTTQPPSHPTTTEEQAMNTTVRSITAAAALASALPAAPLAAAYPADGWFLRDTDLAGGTSSFDGSGSAPGGWTNATGAVSLGMAANGNYFILNDKETYLIRTPDNAVSYAAPVGASLTVTPGARLTLAFKGSMTASRPEVTIPDVRIMEGARLALFPAHSFYNDKGEKITGTDVLKGNISIVSGSELLINTYAQDADVRQNELAASVTGKGTITWAPNASATTSTRHNAYVTGDLSGFSGNIVHYSPELVTGYNILSLENENSIPANPAPGETAHVAISNGVSFMVQRAFWDSAANRSWDFGSGRTPFIAVGTQARVVIRGRATGSSGFTKNGYGPLVFAGETDISGTATVVYGVVYVEEAALALTNSVTWSVTAGDAVVHYPDSVEMPTLYLKATDTSGQSSMSGTTSCGGWATTPSGTASKTAAVMKKKYVVDGGSSPYALRSPNAINKNYVFGGNTLMVKNGSVVNVLSKNGSDFAERTLTVADLRVPAEGFCKMLGASGLKPYGWGGEYTIAASGEMDFCGAAVQTNNIYAKISGAGKLLFAVNTAANPPSKQDDFLYGDLSGFTGAIEAQATGSGTKSMLGFMTASSFPGDMASKTPSGLVAANGVRLVFAASGTIGPNRGVDFGNGTRTEIHVAAGETVTISSEVYGASGFEKTGAGTLVLAGKLRGLSGTVRVSAGTLMLPSESRCKSFTLDIAPGATVVHAREPGTVVIVK